MLAPLALLVSVSGCSKEKPSSRVLHLPLACGPISLDPRYTRIVHESTFMRHVFEGLTRETPEGFELGLADEILCSDDYKTYIFKLKKTFWSNGDPLTSNDFKESWKQVLSPVFPKATQSHFESIKNATAISQGKLESEHLGIFTPDPQTLVVKLEYSDPFFPEIVCKPVFLPVHYLTRESYNNESLPHPIFSGPFTIQDGIEGHKIILKKNPYYWDYNSVYLQEIVFFLMNNSHTINLLFKKNEIDFQGQPLGPPLPRDLLYSLKNTGLLHNFEVNGTFWLNFNIEKEGLSDINLRKALAFSIDKQKLIDTILRGDQKKAEGLFPYSYVPKDTDRDPLKYWNIVKQNPETMRHIDKLSLIYPSNLQLCSMIAQALQQQWKKILGIDISLNGMEYQSYIHKRRIGDFTLSTGGWICMNRLFKNFVSGVDGGYAISHWKNKKFMELGMQLKHDNNGSKKTTLTENINDLICEELPILPLYHYNFSYILAPGIKGIRELASGNLDFKYVIREEAILTKN